MAPSAPRSESTATLTVPLMVAQVTPGHGTSGNAVLQITSGYTGDSLGLKIILAFLIGLGLYNALEFLLMCLITFNKYSGLYFWSMVVAGAGIIPYELGFLIKVFQLLDASKDSGYVSVTLQSVGWYMMVIGMSAFMGYDGICH